METAMDKLEEYVLDEDKIVTISSFAHDVHISLQDAKEVLRKYRDANQDKIHATYILNGTAKKDKQNYVVIVKDSDLEKKKQLFEDNVTETVYSIQKSDKIDFQIIALADPVNEKSLEEPLPGAIISKNCSKRVIKKRALPPAPTPQSKPSIFGKSSTSNIKSEKNGNAENTSNQSKTKNSQGGIANMFTKMSQNKSEEKPKPDKEKPKPKNQGISGFFVKKSSSESMEKMVTKSEENLLSPKKEKVTPKKDRNSPKENHEKKQKIKNELFDSDSNDEVEQMMMKMDVDPVKELKPKKSEIKKEKKPVKKRRARNDAADNQSKRRKRIMVQDSDSDEVFASEKEDNSLSETEEQPVEEVVKKPLAPKNKKRKAVEKTYQDAEGFIVTKTEYVYETASEEENEEPTKKIVEKPKVSLLNKSSNSNSDLDVVEGTPQKSKRGKKGAQKPSGSQPTLMNFFTKK